MRSDGRDLPAHIQVEKGQRIVVGEHGRHARFRNPESREILKVRVDGGLITRGERADYIVANPEVVDVIVELKGSDVSKAIQQVRATLPVWRQSPWAGRRQGALIVRGKGIHPKLQARMEQWKREFRKTLHIRLLIETSNRSYEFTEFLLSVAEPAV